MQRYVAHRVCRLARTGQIRKICAQAAAVEEHGLPSPSGAAASPKVQALLDDLVSLNMLEVKELTDGLKDRLGIEDSAAMPMMSPGMFAAAPAAETAEEKAPEKTAFDLKLDKFEASKKIAVIKEIRAITGLGLKEAKQLVEDSPKVFKTDVSKEEAEQIRDKLKDIGGVVVLE